MSSQASLYDDSVLMRSFIEPLSQMCPKISIHSSQISFLESPCAFHDSLLTAIHAAKDSIILASLYLGSVSVSSEMKILEALELKLKNSTSTFTLTILLDSLRAHRPSRCADGSSRSSQSILAPLEANYPTKVKVIYYKHNNRSFSQNCLPFRWNETVGYLQHMKFYVFDDVHVLLSGANLSHDYYTNRTDRYMWVRDCAQLGVYYRNVMNLISLLQKKGIENEQVIRAQLDFLKPFPISSKISMPLSRHTQEFDTALFPSLQIPGLVNQDHVVACALLRAAMFTREQKHTIYLSTAYFNLAEAYRKIIDAPPSSFVLPKGESMVEHPSSECPVHIYTAAPKSNGFYGSKGLSRYIPFLYDYLAQMAQQSPRLNLWEWTKSGWTFHSKGLWISRQNDPLPFLTMIGSSNYGQRSIQRDLENGLAIVTNNVELKQKFEQDLNRIRTYSKPLEKRAVATWIPWMTKLVRNLL